MKKISILIIVTLISMTGFTQGDEKKESKKPKGAAQIDAAQVPDAVKNAFTIQATDLRWEKKESKGKDGKVKVRYVAVYTQDGIRTRTRFKKDGSPMSSSRYLEPQQLPASIKSAAATKNPGAKLMGGEEVTTKKKEVYYRIRQRSGSTKIISFYDSKGAEVKKDKIEDDSKDEEEWN